MNKLLVPIIENSELGNSQCCLFSVTAKTLQNRSKSLFNGCYYHYLNQKLSQSFTTERFSFEIYRNGKSDENDVFDNFSENTASISLGCFCAAYAVINNRQLKKQYGSITVTGNWNLTDTGNVVLSDVSLVREKFLAVKGYAEKYPNEDHLFVYISSKEEVDEGFHDNVLVIRFSSEDSINLVFAEIFEPVFSREQKKDSFALREMRPNTFVQTNSFIKWKKELASPGCGGFILQGETNTGKSIIANSLCEWLLESRCVDSVVWIIVNSYKLWEAIKEEATCRYEKKVTESPIKLRYETEFLKIDYLLKVQKKVILVFDNLEYDFVDSLVTFFKFYYSKKAENLKLIITSQKRSKDKKLLDELGINEKELTAGGISEAEFLKIADTLINQSQYTSKFSDEDEKREFLSLIQKHFIYQPGYIRTVLGLLANNTVKETIAVLDGNNVLPKKNIIWKIVIEQLDFLSRLILYAYIANRFVFDRNEIIEKIDYLFSYEIGAEDIITPRVFSKAIYQLSEATLLEKRTSGEYVIPTDALVYCLFSKVKTKEIERDIALCRESIITIWIKLQNALSLPLEYSPLGWIKNVFKEHKSNVKNGKSRIAYQDVLDTAFLWACERNADMELLKYILDCGANPNREEDYGNKHGQSYLPLCELTENTDSIGKLDIALLRGADPLKRTRTGESMLIAAAKNADSTILKFVLEKHLYQDINKTDSNGRSALSYAVLTSTENVDLLLRAGAIVYDETIALCIKYDYYFALKYLLYRKAINKKRLNKSMKGYGCTPLMLSSSVANSATTKILLDYGADCFIKDNDGWTSFDYATANLPVLKWYYKKGLLKEKFHLDQALFYSCLLGSQKAFEFLISVGANLKTISNEDGYTPLHCAVLNKNTAVLRYLLENKEKLSLDIFEKGKDGTNAYEFAKQAENWKALKILKQYYVN